MAYQTTGYYNPTVGGAVPTAPRAPMAPMAPAAPGLAYTGSTYTPARTTTYAASTTYNPYATGTTTTMTPQTTANIQSVIAGAPMIAGAMPGKAATDGVIEAKQLYFDKAKFMKVTTAKSAYNKASTLTEGRGALWGTIGSAIKSSLIWNGLLSAAINGYQVYTKQETTQDAGANFAGDMSTAVLGGAAAGAACAGGTFLLTGLLGVGLPLTLAGMAIGAVAYFVVANLWQTSPLYNQLKTAVHGMA